MKPEDAEEYTLALGQVVAGGWRQIALGQRLGVPKALGLSVDTWVKQRLGGYVKLSLEERRQAAAELSATGHTEREIAAVIGVSPATAHRALDASDEAGRNSQSSTKKPATASNEADPLDVIAGISTTEDARAAAQIRAARERREQQNKATLQRQVVVSTEGVVHGDFRARYAETLAPDSVQLVLTDPPYDKDSIGLFGAAAVAAQQVLRPGGSLLIYSGQKYLGEVIAAMSPHLRYWWTFALVHQGSSQLLQKLGLRCGWKPILWFVKDTRGDVTSIVPDIVEGAGREKDAHEWQQGEAEAATLIERFTNPGDLVVDFFAGSGTVIAAAKKLDRRCVGFETRADNIEKIEERIA